MGSEAYGVVAINCDIEKFMTLNYISKRIHWIIPILFLIKLILQNIFYEDYGGWNQSRFSGWDYDETHYYWTYTIPNLWVFLMPLCYYSIIKSNNIPNKYLASFHLFVIVYILISNFFQVHYFIPKYAEYLNWSLFSLIFLQFILKPKTSSGHSD